MSNTKHITKKCVDCGSKRIRAHCSCGWVCDACWAKRQADDDGWAARPGGTLMQFTDPDSAPLPCGHVGCNRDAVAVVRIHIGTPNERAVTGCEEDQSQMASVAMGLVSK